ncbi:hypothetical protein BD779DRAFT_1442450, partial [Infundibulicybe gibba]
APKCRGKGGIRRYQDSKDRAATSNLKGHAIKCFGRDVVNAAFNNAQANSHDGSIFAAFAQLSQPATVSHRTHTSEETRDREFRSLMMAGRPSLALPSPSTVSRDIRAAFQACRERIDTILKEHPDRIHFATDAWTSPNHRAFVAWTVHLQHKGRILVFLLDFMEVPEVSHLPLQ